MKRGDKLEISELAKEQEIAKNWKNIVCYSKQPNADGIIIIERDGIQNPEKRARCRIHKDFFKVKVVVDASKE